MLKSKPQIVAIGKTISALEGVGARVIPVSLTGRSDTEVLSQLELIFKNAGGADNVVPVFEAKELESRANILSGNGLQGKKLFEIKALGQELGRKHALLQLISIIGVTEFMKHFGVTDPGEVLNVEALMKYKLVNILINELTSKRKVEVAA